MKAIILRVNRAILKVDDEIVSQIEKGLVVFIGIEREDNDRDLELMKEKILNLRIFDDDEGKLNLSLLDKRYSLLCVPNFTLCADIRKGRRPSFNGSEEKVKANEKFHKFVDILKESEINIKEGVFGKEMNIEMELHGPVNIIVDTRRL